MKKLLVLFAIIMSVSSLLAQNDSSTVVISSGYGITKEDATKFALRNAIELAFGTFISSKTELLNDDILTDQIISISNGNIIDFRMIDNTALPNGFQSVTVEAKVSVGQLSKFVESKGVQVEFKGGLLAANIKQKILNEKSELNMIIDLIGLMHENMQLSFDYSIEIKDPLNSPENNNIWEVPGKITVRSNNNVDICKLYCLRMLESISMKPSEIESYKALNRKYYKLSINSLDGSRDFYLRNISAHEAFKTFISEWSFFTRDFFIRCGDEDFECVSGSCNSEETGHNFNFSRDNFTFKQHEIWRGDILLLNFPKVGEVIREINFTDKRTLIELEKIDGYNIFPLGIISPYKYGGFVINEFEGHGLVLSVIDVHAGYSEIFKSCETLELAGYNDWELPNLEQMKTTIMSTLDFNS
jgi:hypothetical protein